jgi:hypothetical protein
VVLVALAGARRTDTAVARFLHYSGPTEGQVANVSQETMGRIAALPSVAYSVRGALMLAIPVTPDGRLAATCRSWDYGRCTGTSLRRCWPAGCRRRPARSR